MFALDLALLGSTCGFLLWYSRAGRPWRRLLGVLALHLCLVAVGTLSLELLAAPCGAPVLAAAVGAWFTVLTGVHVGHWIAVRQWGTPLNRSVVAYTARNLRQLVAAAPSGAVRGVVALAIVFAGGATTVLCDLHAGTLAPMRLGFLRTLLPIAAVLVGITGLWLVRFNPWRDPLLRLLVGAQLGDYRLPQGDPRRRELEVQLGTASAQANDREPPRFAPAVARPLLRSESGISAGRRATVVLFVVDSLRARNLSFHGYGRPTTPFLSSCLAERGAQAIPLAVSNCASTECGSWSLQTSRRYRHLALNSPDLRDVLRRAGYKVRFFLSGMHLGWKGLEHLYGADHDLLLDGVADTRLIAEAANLPAQEPQGSDFLCFHLMSVHSTGALERQFRTWLPSYNRVPYAGGVCPDARVHEGIVNHYDNTIIQADDYIRQILVQLEQKAYLRDAVVIVTSDHGESLGERAGSFGTIGHGTSVFQESIHIPFLLMDTQGSLPETSLLADQTDVAPTVADLLGIEAPDSWQGQSVFRKPFRQSTHVEFVASFGKRRALEAVLSVGPAGVHKLLRHRESGRESLRAAFCLSTDPDEMCPINDAAILAELEAVRGEFAGSPRSDKSQRRCVTVSGRRQAA